MQNVIVKSAKGTDACHQAGEELAIPLGGMLDSVPVLREFLRSAKGTAACHHTREELAISSGGTLDAVPVLREFLSSTAAANRMRHLLTRLQGLCPIKR